MIRDLFGKGNMFSFIVELVITCAFFLNIMTQISSHRGADPLVIGAAGSCVCCLMSKKAKQMGGCWPCPGSKVFFWGKDVLFQHTTLVG